MEQIRAKNFEVKISNGAIAPTSLISSSLTASQKIVWLAIRNCEGKKDIAWPSLSTIARLSCLDKKTVFEAIHGCPESRTIKNKGKLNEKVSIRHAKIGLASLGWLKVGKYASKNTGNTHNTYECWIPVDAGTEKDVLTPTPVDAVHHPDYQTGQVIGNTRNQHNEPNHEPTLQPSAAVASSGVTDVAVSSDDGRTTDVSMRDVRTDADIVAVIEAFRPVTPFPPFGNKTQRKAAADLIKMFGLEQTLKAIEVVIAKRGTEYFPSVVSPYDLREKWGKVVGHIQRNKPKPTLYEIGSDGRSIDHYSDGSRIETFPDGRVINHPPKA